MKLLDAVDELAPMVGWLGLVTLLIFIAGYFGLLDTPGEPYHDPYEYRQGPTSCEIVVEHGGTC